MHIFIFAISGYDGNDIWKVSENVSDIYDTYNTFINSDEVIAADNKNCNISKYNIEIYVWKDGEEVFSSYGENAVSELEMWVTSLLIEEPIDIYSPLIPMRVKEIQKFLPDFYEGIDFDIDMPCHIDINNFDDMRKIMVKDIKDKLFISSILGIIDGCELEGMTTLQTLDRLVTVLLK